MEYPSDKLFANNSLDISNGSSLYHPPFPELSLSTHVDRNFEFNQSESSRKEEIYTQETSRTFVRDVRTGDREIFNHKQYYQKQFPDEIGYIINPPSINNEKPTHSNNGSNAKEMIPTLDNIKLETRNNLEVKEVYDVSSVNDIDSNKNTGAPNDQAISQTEFQSDTKEFPSQMNCVFQDTLSLYNDCSIPTLDTTSDIARCSSPLSTTQSVSSLPSDTITINLPYDSSTSDSELHNFDCDNGTLNKTTNVSSSINDQNMTKVPHRQISSETSLSADSALALSSPVLTESCTITPIQADITPYSTNPTSTPLPSPIPSELLVPSINESTDASSTSSIITMADMNCVSQKLEHHIEFLGNNNANNNHAFNCKSDSNKHTNIECLSKHNEAQRYVTGLYNAEVDASAVATKNLAVSQLSSFFESRCFINKSESQENKTDLQESLSLKPHTSNELTNFNDQGNIKVKNSVTMDRFEYKHQEKNDYTLSDIKERKWFIYNQPNNKNENVINKYDFINNNRNYASNKNELFQSNIMSHVTVCDDNLKPFGTEKSSINESKKPPIPPPRSNFYYSKPPPVPPPPIEDEAFYIKTPSFGIPPQPPVRQYILIPLNHERRPPTILTPPPIVPPRSSSLPRTSTSPQAYKSEIPIIDANKIETMEMEKSFKDNYISKQENDQLKKNGWFINSLTPVPEEKSSPKVSPPLPSDHLREKSQNIKQDETLNFCSTKLNKQIDMDHNNKVSNLINYFQSEPIDTNPPPLPPKPSLLNFSALSSRLSPPSKMPICHSTKTIPEISLSFSNFISCNDRLDVSFAEMSTSGTSEKEHNLPVVPPVSSGLEESTILSNPVILPEPTPPAPPPPIQPCTVKHGPVLSISPYGKIVIDRSDLPLPSHEDEVCKVFENSKAFGWINHGKDTLAIYTQIKPQIQRGPQCGLVALSMASQVLHSNVSVESLLQKAREKEYSSHGEMFSADSMKLLADQCLEGIESFVRTDLLTNPSLVVKCLLEGDLILVPYDAENNHLPGLHHGRKSHWGLICGCLVQSSLAMVHPETTGAKRDSKIDSLWHFKPKTFGSEGYTTCERRFSEPTTLIHHNKSSPECTRTTRSLPPEFDTKSNFQKWCLNISNLIILWRQGKSRNLMASPIEDLQKSNNQLIDYFQTIDYVIENVEKGLCGKVVVLHKIKSGNLQEHEKL